MRRGRTRACYRFGWQPRSTGRKRVTAVQIVWRAWGWNGLCPLLSGKALPFRPICPGFLLIRAAAKAMPSAARMRLLSSPRQRKGTAFPQSKRRSRRSALNSRIVIWTRVKAGSPGQGSPDRGLFSSDAPAATASRQSGWGALLPSPCPKQNCCYSTTAYLLAAGWHCRSLWLFARAQGFEVGFVFCSASHSLVED